MTKTKRAKKRAKSPAANTEIQFATPPPQGEIISPTPGQTGQVETLTPAQVEWESTVRAKEGFLAFFSENLVSISKACAVMRVGRSTYYDWMQSDPAFKVAFQDAEVMQNDLAEDLFYELVQEKDGASVRFHLERRTEKWKSKQVLEHHIGNTTLEDLLDADNAKEHAKDTPGIDRGPAKDSQQAEGHSPLQIERSPAVLLEPANAPQPVAESAPEGIDQGN